MQGVVIRAERNGRCVVATELGNFIVEFDEGPLPLRAIISGLRYDHGYQRLYWDGEERWLRGYVNGLP